MLRRISIFAVTFLTLLSSANSSASRDVLEKIAARLDRTLNYVLDNYEEINVDCLFGVVLAQALLEDVSDTYYNLDKLKNRTREIYKKTSPLMEKQLNWYFTKDIVVPKIWQKHFRYKPNEFRMAYAVRSKVDALFSPKTYENWTETFSDFCISAIVNNTVGTSPKMCHLNKKCETYIEDLEDGAGYMLTHKLLLLQVARVRKCKMNPKILAASIKRVCHVIYTETISVEFFSSLDEIFDLFLEQIILCGYEGYSDFLNPNWLSYILKVQHESGCFPSTVTGNTGKRKRETNQWKDGCADHTTGLGAAVLALYLNYYTKTLV